MRSMRVLILGGLALASLAGAAQADGPPAPPPPPAPMPPIPEAPALPPAPPTPSPEAVVEFSAVEGFEAPAAAPCAPPCAAPCVEPCTPRCKRVRLTLEGVFGWLPDPEGAFGLDSFFPDQLRWSTLTFDGELGGRATVEVFTGPNSSIEARGLWLGGFEDSERQTGVFGFAPATPAPPMVPGLVPGVSAANTGTFTAEADLWSAELNSRFCMASGCFRVESILGARVLSFTEDALASDFATAFVPGYPLSPFVSSGVENLFVGAQAGLMSRWRPSRCWEWNLGAKLMLGNLSREIEVADRGVFSGAAHAAALEEDEIVFGFEVEAGVRWQVTDWLAFTGGYSLLFLDNVQRATDAMYFGASTSGAVQARSDLDQLTAHAVFLGVSFDF